MKTTIYTNGISLFTLRNYNKAAGVCHALNITLHSEVSKLKARSMHENGQLHYISGMGDRKVLSALSLNRSMTFNNFNIS
tara:strand:+ start:2496 stop:2735 length:240 start_codon:yes stop_codon:yes gene_type:complete